MAKVNFRDYLIPFDTPRLVQARSEDPYTYAKPIIATQRATELIAIWQSLLAEPYTGITTNGEVEKNLFEIADEGLEIERVVRAAEKLLAVMTEGERARAQYPIDATEWRDWYNPEWPRNENGLRLDYASSGTRGAVIGLLRASFGYEGYVKTNRCRSANLFLGELYDLRNIMSEWSYHFLMFGTPSLTGPWGWNLYGHHLALNCFFLGRQMVVSPTFLGAEVTTIDRGPHDKFRLFENEENSGLDLIRSLTPAMRERVITYKNLKDPAMPEGRWHFADERQLGAAYRDNRIIPFEGVPAAEFNSSQQEMVLKTIESFIDYLPSRPRLARMRQIESHLDRTYFSWMGDYGDEDPFYYRVQSPVIMVELDHHCGVWLTNPNPAKYHVHTVVRTPNGNDYGKDLLRQHYLQQHQKGSAHVQGDAEPVKSVHGNHDHAESHHHHDHPHEHSHSHGGEAHHHHHHSAGHDHEHTHDDQKELIRKASDDAA